MLKIEEVIGAIIPLKKNKGLCPFHDDKHPSLSIHPEKQIFKCFSCGKGGDAARFIELYYGITRKEAIDKIGGNKIGGNKIGGNNNYNTVSVKNSAQNNKKEKKRKALVFWLDRSMKIRKLIYIEKQSLKTPEDLNKSNLNSLYAKLLKIELYIENLGGDPVYEMA